jgi:hypothetical protein
VLRVLIEAEAFPIVRIRYDRTGPAGQDNYLELFEALLDREQPFVLIGNGAQLYEESHEERKHIALWMKRNRARLNRLVRAMVYVEPNTEQRLASRPAAFVFEKFWGFPMLVSESDREAMSIAESLLAASAV